MVVVFEVYQKNDVSVVQDTTLEKIVLLGIKQRLANPKETSICGWVGWCGWDCMRVCLCIDPWYCAPSTVSSDSSSSSPVSLFGNEIVYP